MCKERKTLCGASSYEQKFYLNPEFEGLPKHIKEELKIMCVLYTADVGGILTLEYEDDGTLELVTRCSEGDFSYDEIGAHLKIKQIQKDKQELLESLELYYKVIILKQHIG